MRLRSGKLIQCIQRMARGCFRSIRFTCSVPVFVWYFVAWAQEVTATARFDPGDLLLSDTCAICPTDSGISGAERGIFRWHAHCTTRSFEEEPQLSPGSARLDAAPAPLDAGRVSRAECLDRHRVLAVR